MNDNGFIVIQRKITEWQYFDCPTALYLWIRILVKANWKDGWFAGKPIPRGSFATSIGNFADEIKLHPNTIRKWLKKFEEAGQITVKSTNKYTLITVINYAKYQDVPDDRVKRDVKQDVEQDVNQRVNQDVNQRVDNRTNKQINQVTNKPIIKRFITPTIEEVQAYIDENYFMVDANKFFDYYTANGWTIGGKSKMKDWKATVRNWDRREQESLNHKKKERTGLAFDDI